MTIEKSAVQNEARYLTRVALPRRTIFFTRVANSASTGNLASAARAAVVCGAALCCMGQTALGQTISRKEMSYAMAKSIAEGALEKCKSEGYAVSAVVVDRDGETVIALRGDDATVQTMENARRKAYTAMAFKIPTTAYAKKFADKNPTVLQQVTLPNVIAIGGGLPIKSGDEVLGGAGISGSPGVDEACTQAGLDKVVDQLK